jgi:hypothetical protein
VPPRYSLKNAELQQDGRWLLTVEHLGWAGREKTQWDFFIYLPLNKGPQITVRACREYVCKKVRSWRLVRDIVPAVGRQERAIFKQAIADFIAWYGLVEYEEKRFAAVADHAEAGQSPRE